MLSVTQEQLYHKNGYRYMCLVTSEKILSYLQSPSAEGRWDVRTHLCYPARYYQLRLVQETEMEPVNEKALKCSLLTITRLLIKLSRSEIVDEEEKILKYEIKDVYRTLGMSKRYYNRERYEKRKLDGQ